MNITYLVTILLSQASASSYIGSFLTAAKDYGCTLSDMMQGSKGYSESVPSGYSTFVKKAVTSTTVVTSTAKSVGNSVKAVKDNIGQAYKDVRDGVEKVKTYAEKLEEIREGVQSGRLVFSLKPKCIKPEASEVERRAETQDVLPDHISNGENGSSSIETEDSLESQVSETDLESTRIEEDEFSDCDTDQEEISEDVYSDIDSEDPNETFQDFDTEDVDEQSNEIFKDVDSEDDEILVPDQITLSEMLLEETAEEQSSTPTKLAIFESSNPTVLGAELIEIEETEESISGQEESIEDPNEATTQGNLNGLSDVGEVLTDFHQTPSAANNIGIQEGLNGSTDDDREVVIDFEGLEDVNFGMTLDQGGANEVGTLESLNGLTDDDDEEVLMDFGTHENKILVTDPDDIEPTFTAGQEETTDQFKQVPDVNDSDTSEDTIIKFKEEEFYFNGQKEETIDDTTSAPTPTVEGLDDTDDDEDGETKASRWPASLMMVATLCVTVVAASLKLFRLFF